MFLCVWVNGFINNWFKFVFRDFSLTFLLVPAAVFKQTLWVLGSVPSSPFISGILPPSIDVAPHFYSHAADLY